MAILQCYASACGKQYQLRTFEPVVLSSVGASEVKCPHCGAATGNMLPLPFFTRAVPVDREGPAPALA